MSCAVVPDSLDAFADLLGRADDDAAAALRHLHRYADIPPTSGGLFSIARQHHRMLCGPLGKSLADLSGVLEAARCQLHIAATNYRRTERDAEQRVAAALPSAHG
jgi:hypothetical protein